MVVECISGDLGTEESRDHEDAKRHQKERDQRTDEHRGARARRINNYNPVASLSTIAYYPVATAGRPHANLASQRVHFCHLSNFDLSRPASASCYQ